jgi:hypothetical protein
MWVTSATAQETLGTAHNMDVRATAYTAALGAVPGIPISGGTVTVSATSQRRRSATISLADPAFWPTHPYAVLSALGSELQVDYGIIMPGGDTEWVPLIRGLITDVARTRPTTGGDSAFQVTVADLSAKVAQARFDRPTQTVAGATVVAEIRRLITETIPGATVTDRTGSTMIAAVLDMERERWADGVERLADALAAEVFADPTGSFVIRPQPTLADEPVWTVNTGDAGTVVGLDEKLTRDTTYNRVVASGQRTDGTPPVYAVADDTDPTSPTYIGGPFGIRTRYYVSPLLTTVLQCSTAAAGLLARTIGMHGTIDLDVIPNPALDAGDVLRLVDGATTSVHIIDTVTIPLDPRTPARISTRSMDIPQEV